MDQSTGTPTNAANAIGSGDTSNMRSKTAAVEREQIEARDRKYRQGWDGGYDSGYQDAYADALKDPMMFCVCKSGGRCKFVEDVADGHAETCWYCTFLDGETPCPVEAEDER